MHALICMRGVLPRLLCGVSFSTRAAVDSANAVSLFSRSRPGGRGFTLVCLSGKPRTTAVGTVPSRQKAEKDAISSCASSRLVARSWTTHDFFEHLSLILPEQGGRG